MTRLETKLRIILPRLGVGKADRVVVATSGGADSTALVDALVRWKGNLVVAHLNHMLRGDEADEDARFVAEFSRSRRLDCIIEGIDVGALAATRKANLEATAREVRYQFLKRAALQCGAGVVFTAHTSDDQVETLLMRLVRGTGAAGWNGIHQVRQLGEDIRVLRPMLGISRAEVIAHCDQRGVAYRNDSSNECQDFTRNRIRANLLPLLRGFNPEFDDALIKLAAEVHSDHEYIQLEALTLVDEHCDGDIMRFYPLRERPAALTRLVLREWLRRNRGDLRRIGRSHLEALERLVTSGEGGSYVELPGGWTVTRRREVLKLQPKSEG